ncbi:hypothetical protein GCM10011380_19440 [Sphingomonas metalli]|uniref:Uncharacterized protein n=1 Tax=Sphingomonas metalli TaxID=1779358 RepID=A0A916T3I4_9SPHN|nr:hypothetical protein [Sphingomonas metalli]GGB30107.1 hypothetical protein GCM10011380_19440 [Sphingomonas metalli]
MLYAMLGCALLVALFVHQHQRVQRAGRRGREAMILRPVRVQRRTRPIPAKLYRHAPDWTRVEAYDMAERLID